VAEIVTDEADDKVVTVKLTLVAPAGTVTLAATVAAEVLLLASVTTAPPSGAGPFNVTVPVTGVPWVTLLELRDKEMSAGEFTIRLAPLLPL